MELNINEMRLTDQEVADAVVEQILNLGENKEPMKRAALDRRIADAQLAKALWGIAGWLGNWLDHNYPKHVVDIGELGGGKCPHCALVRGIIAANIPNPAAEVRDG